MASARQIRALLSSFRDRDDERFYSVAMQMAAHEARKGHDNVAREIRELVDEAKEKRQKPSYQRRRGPTPIAQPKGELSGLLTVRYPELRLNSMVLSETLEKKLVRLVKEYGHLEEIRRHGLSPRRKLLLVGPPGTGKTMASKALAGELGLPLFVVRFEALLTRFMGETAAKLSQIFDHIRQHRGVYLFDEFDSIGSMRTLGNDVGEIRRVLNSFLQLIEVDDSDSIILAATNHPSLLDVALFRRFDDILEFEVPGESQVRAALEAKLSFFDVSDKLNWRSVLEHAHGLSYAELARACEEAIKGAIISDKDSIDSTDLERELEERQRMKKQMFDAKGD